MPKMSCSAHPHNLVRHPDMPEEAFADLWAYAQSRQTMDGLVKNRRKDGGFYWVEANVTPIYDGGELAGYMSVRYKPTRGADRCRRNRLYRTMRAGRCRLSLDEGRLVSRGHDLTP